MVSHSKHTSKKRTAKRSPDIDIAMLKDNLKRSYAERIRRHQIALETMQMLQKAKLVKEDDSFTIDAMLDIKQSMNHRTKRQMIEQLKKIKNAQK
jgi:hypothetical protein